MRARFLALILAIVCAVAMGEPVTVEDAAATVDEAPTGEADTPAGGPAAVSEDAVGPPLDAKLTLTYDDYYDLDETGALDGGLSVDLIDLDALREAIEAKVSSTKLRITLDECIRIALLQNQDIVITAFEPQKADADLLTAKGEFDLAWQTTGNYVRSSSQASQEIYAYGGIDSIDAYRTTIDSAVGGKLHYGTQYSLAFHLTKEETTFGRFIEEFGGQMMLTLTQPLLRGFGKRVNTVRIQAARNARQMSDEQLRVTVMKAVADVINAYWDLVGTVENLKVREDALANAERLLRISETRRNIGTAADIEVLQARAGVATRQSELIAARSRIADASDLLKSLLNLRDGDLLSKVQLVPVDRPNLRDRARFDPDNIEATLDRSIANAIEHRPEIVIADLQIESAELDAMRSRNEMLPEFNLTGSYAQGGRDHKLRQMLYGIRGKDEDTYTYGFRATVPIGNRAARGAYTRAKLAQRQAELQRDQTKQGLVLNVHLPCAMP